MTHFEGDGANGLGYMKARSMRRLAHIDIHNQIQYASDLDAASVQRIENVFRRGIKALVRMLLPGTSESEMRQLVISRSHSAFNQLQHPWKSPPLLMRSMKSLSCPSLLPASLRKCSTPCLSPSEINGATTHSPAYALDKVPDRRPNRNPKLGGYLGCSACRGTFLFYDRLRQWL